MLVFLYDYHAFMTFQKLSSAKTSSPRLFDWFITILFFLFLTTLNMPIKFSSFSRSHQTTKVYACNLPKSCRLQIQISKFTEFFPRGKRRIRCYKIGQVFFSIFWKTTFILPSMIFLILRTDIKNRRENHMFFFIK